MATSSFFYGGSSAPEQNTVDELIDALNQKTAAADQDRVAAEQARDRAETAASNAELSETNVAGLASQAQSTLTEAQAAVAAANAAVSGTATNAATATTKAAEAASSAIAADVSADAALASENAAAVSATSAATSAAAASAQAAGVSASAASAASSASAAAGSASTATTQATNAGTSATAAAVSASAASTSATNAASSASAASTSATAAASSASAASTSATNAAASATSASGSAATATTQATNASNSASAASTSATNAAASATAAFNSASNASTSESNAATSASVATTQAGIATTQATNAATSASTATTQATNAASSATTAATEASNAASSATSAASSATSAASSAASAAAALDSFDDRYLGSKTSDPTVDNDGNALVTGALYYRSTTPTGMKVYDGAQWISASSAQQAALVTFEYVATAGQTTFSGNDANGVPLAYTVGNVFVSLNGVRLRPGDDFTASTGTSIVLLVAAAAGDEVVVDAFSSFQVANTYTQAQVDAALATKQAADAELTTLAGMSSNRATYLASNEGFGFRNRIINGAMMIDQRNAGASVAASGTANSSVFGVDRWAIFSTSANRFTMQQNAGSVTPPSGFRNYQGITSTSAYTPAAGETSQLYQNIEGFNFADLMWGTTNAQTVTISFWVRSSLTGNFGGAVTNEAQNRSYPFLFAINSANTWEQKVLTIPGDTSGTWVTGTGRGVTLIFDMATGSNFKGAAGVWAAANLYSAVGATSVFGTNGATFYITGVQLEKGSTATPFDYRPYGTELALCMRYYEKSFQQSVAPNNNGIGLSPLAFAVSWGGSQAGYTSTRFAVVKRAVPTIVQYGNASGQLAFLTSGSLPTTQNTYSYNANLNIIPYTDTEFAFNNQATQSVIFNVLGGWAASAEL